jgi:hypothetical protein
MGDLADFLAARIYDDEQLAAPFRNELGDVQQWRADEIGGAVRQVGTPAFGLPDLLATFETHLEADHVAQWDPARVLLECEAKRGILLDYMTRRRRYETEARQRQGAARESFVPPHGYTNPRPSDLPLRYLALPYRAHPEYSEAWAPPAAGTVETWGRR